MSSAVRDLLRPVARHPSAVLLVVQLVGVLLYPFAESLAWGRGLFELFGALVLGLAVWSVRDSPGPTSKPAFSTASVRCVTGFTNGSARNWATG